MNEHAHPDQILDRYRDATPQELNEQELTNVQKYLAESSMQAVFGALPFQQNSRFVSKEIKTAKERIPGATVGPYFVDNKYEPTGLMLYTERPTTTD